MNSLTSKTCLLMFGFAAVAMLAVAQENQSPAPGRALERVEQFKKVRLMEVLSLDEQSSIKFFARYNKHQEVLREIRQKQVQALGRVQANRKAKAADVEYDKIVEELLSLENKATEAKAKYVSELKQVLSSKQLAEYLVFETRFQQNLRDLVRDLTRSRTDPLR
jgi:hypothetical protein